MRQKHYIFSLCFIGLMASSPASADNDFQVWLDLDAGGTFTYKISAKGKQSFRWKDNAGTLATYFSDFSLTYQFNPVFNLTGAYHGTPGWPVVKPGAGHPLPVWDATRR